MPLLLYPERPGRRQDGRNAPVLENGVGYRRLGAIGQRSASSGQWPPVETPSAIGQRALPGSLAAGSRVETESGQPERPNLSSRRQKAFSGPRRKLSPVGEFPSEIRESLGLCFNRMLLGGLCSRPLRREKVQRPLGPQQCGGSPLQARRLCLQGSDRDTAQVSLMLGKRDFERDSPPPPGPPPSGIVFTPIQKAIVLFLWSLK